MGQGDTTFRSLNRHLGLSVRVLIAVVGLTYVGTTLTWRDSVALPGGYVVEGEVVTEEDAEYPVVEMTDQTVAFSLDEERTATLEVSQLSQTAKGARLLPGILTTVRRADVAMLVLGLLLIGPIFPIQSARWCLLMRCRDLQVTWYRAFRLTFAGAFFNTFMPGMTGGDIMKAYWATRGSTQRGAAVISVVVDRMVGLVSLILLGAAAGIFSYDDPQAGHATTKIWIILTVLIMAVVTYLSRRLRKWFGLTYLLGRLQQENPLRRLDDAAAAYRSHLTDLFWALVMSMPVHLLAVLSISISGYGLGVSTPLVTLIAVLPLVLLAGALPLSFMGFGVMEPIGIALLAGTSATTNQVVTMLVLVRVYQIAWSSFGAIFVVRGGLSLADTSPDTEPRKDEVDTAIG